MEIAALIFWPLFAAWEFWPMISILRSSNTSSSEKALWAVGTFLPFFVAICMEKILKWLAPTYAFARDILDSSIAAFLLVMTLLVGGWIVYAIYRVVWENRFQRENNQKQRKELSIRNFISLLFKDI